MRWVLYMPAVAIVTVFLMLLVLLVFMIWPTLIDWYGIMKLKRPTDNDDADQTKDVSERLVDP